MIRKLTGAFLLIVFFLTATYCGNPSLTGPSQPPAGQPTGNQPGNMVVHFLDVGQGDSIFVQLPSGEIMLVDAGTRSMGKNVVNYLKKAGVRKIDYLVATHPHEDHIGGMTAVVQEFEIDRIYMPKVTHSTKTYEDLLKSIQARGLKIKKAVAGVEIINSGELRAELIAPNKASYAEVNNYSTVIKLSFGQVAFLLTGDAEEQSEKEMLASGVSLAVDVLKVGHHGSSSSTSTAFLDAVSPKYAVISCGAGNDYGHPHAETLRKLSGTQIFRTDLDGSIVFTTDGENLRVSAEKR